MSDVEEEHDYDWKCPKCGKSGTNCGDEIWKFCPYCGCTDLEIEELNGEDLSS